MLTIAQAESRVVTKILSGSHIHGINIPTSDADHEAIVIEPIDEVVKLGEPFEELILDGKTRGDGVARSSATEADPVGRVDTKYVSLRKWCRLACKGNPNFLLMLFAPKSHILVDTILGQKLRDMAGLFVSKQIIRSHLGYMKGQRSRMLNQKEGVEGANGGHGRPRALLNEQFGYDTKFAMHLLRLGLQGIELATTARLQLPMADTDRAFLLEVRRGGFTFEDILERSANLEDALKSLTDSSALPDEPDYGAVEQWMRAAYAQQWAADAQLENLHAQTCSTTVQ